MCCRYLCLDWTSTAFTRLNSSSSDISRPWPFTFGGILYLFLIISRPMARPVNSLRSHWSVLFISHPNSLASDSRKFISSNSPGSSKFNETYLLSPEIISVVHVLVFTQISCNFPNLCVKLYIIVLLFTKHNSILKSKNKNISNLNLKVLHHDRQRKRQRGEINGTSSKFMFAQRANDSLTSFFFLNMPSYPHVPPPAIHQSTEHLTYKSETCNKMNIVKLFWQFSLLWDGNEEEWSFLHHKAGRMHVWCCYTRCPLCHLGQM